MLAASGSGDADNMASGGDSGGSDLVSKLLNNPFMMIYDLLKQILLILT